MLNANDNLLQDRQRERSGTQSAVLIRAPMSARSGPSVLEVIGGARPSGIQRIRATDQIGRAAVERVFSPTLKPYNYVTNIADFAVGSVRDVHAETTSATSQVHAGTFTYRVPATAKVLDRLAKQWRLSGPQVSAVLGYSMSTSWDDVLAGRLRFELTTDRKDRVKTLLGVHSMLSGLFGDNTEAASQWLHRSIDELGASPIALISSGSMRDIYLVHDYLQGIVDDVQTE